MDVDIEGDVGSFDIAALEEIRETFVKLDGPVDQAGFDSLLDPTELQVHIDDGIGDATWCRFDVRWYQTGYYCIHHTDENGLDFRFDYHPKPDAPDRHFHQPRAQPPSSSPASRSPNRESSPERFTTSGGEPTRRGTRPSSTRPKTHRDWSRGTPVRVANPKTYRTGNV